MSYGPAELQTDTGVSGAVLENLHAYVGLLRHWQSRINLVAGDSLNDCWRRHVLDSVQLAGHIGECAGTVLDLGSGGGFPGLALAIAMAETAGFRMHLVESNRKKAVFLQTVIRDTNAPAVVHCARVESLGVSDIGGPAAVITARGFAPLSRLLDYAWPFVDDRTKIWLLKGQDIDEELTEASKCWRIGATKHPSRSDPGGCVLEITEIDRA